MAEFEFYTVVGRIGLTVSDGPDADADPDTLRPEAGAEIHFTPAQREVFLTEGGTRERRAVGVHVAYVDTDGYLRGSKTQNPDGSVTYGPFGIKLPRLKGDRVNPAVPDDKGDWTSSYELFTYIANESTDYATTIRNPHTGSPLRLVMGVDNDLANPEVSTVAIGPGVPIVVAPGVVDFEQTAINKGRFVLADDTTTAEIILPPGAPGGSDTSFAQFAGTDGTETKAVLRGGYKPTLTVTGAGIDPTGAADSSTAINQKIAAAVAFGFPSVHIPAGIYKAKIQIPPPAQRVGLKITGDGVGHTVIKAPDAAAQVTVGDGGPTFDAQYVSISDLTLDGNGTAVYNINLNHSRFFRCWEVELKNATSRNVNVVGQIANYFAHFLRVRFALAPMNVLLDGGTNGIGGNSCYFEACHFSGATAAPNYNGTGVPISVVINGGDSNIFRDCEFIASNPSTVSVYLHNSSVGNKIIANQFDGPTTAVNCASTGVERTHIVDNTGTVNITDLGSATVIRQDQYLSGSAGVMAGGTWARANITPLRVRQHAAANTDSFRVEKSDASYLFRTDQNGNGEFLGAVKAHSFSEFDNLTDNSISVRVRTGPASAIANRALVLQAMNASQTGNMLDVLNSAGASIASIGPKGTVRAVALATTGRPAASTAGAGAMYYDTTLSKPLWSDGTAWRDATGAAA